ncbi:hypothetical protein [Halorussus amylolyticus]|uniref:hypothetical protein n=1 Tax=Halorussus amylolyticus TaxID=1126242 RepID=UPI0010524006|nr:hypothetical protein [Halorussus amylolyticus]
MSELEHARDTVKEYHHSIGLPMGGDIDESDFKDADEKASGFGIQMDRQPFIYAIKWESTPFQIRYSYDMAREIEALLDEESARRYADPVEGVDDMSIQEWAAINILDDVSKEDSNDIDFRLRDIMSSYPVWQETYYTRQNRVKGFEVKQYFFPEEEDFTRSTYMEKFAEVATVGQRAQWFLEYTYNLGFGQHGDFGIVEESHNQMP